jgi:hypothetical protein
MARILCGALKWRRRAVGDAAGQGLNRTKVLSCRDSIGEALKDRYKMTAHDVPNRRPSFPVTGVDVGQAKRGLKDDRKLSLRDSFHPSTIRSTSIRCSGVRQNWSLLTAGSSLHQ